MLVVSDAPKYLSFIRVLVELDDCFYNPKNGNVLDKEESIHHLRGALQDIQCDGITMAVVSEQENFDESDWGEELKQVFTKEGMKKIEFDNPNTGHDLTLYYKVHRWPDIDLRTMVMYRDVPENFPSCCGLRWIAPPTQNTNVGVFENILRSEYAFKGKYWLTYHDPKVTSEEALRALDFVPFIVRPEDKKGIWCRERKKTLAEEVEEVDDVEYPIDDDPF